MTDQELKDLVASLAIAQQKTDIQMEKTAAQMAKTDIQLAKTAAQIAKTDAQLAKTDAQLGKTDAKLDKVAKMLGGLGQNQGDIAEEFFYNSFVKDNTLGNLTFDDMTKNMQKRRGRLEEEYDIFLTNGESIAIIEVKYKAHFNDVAKLARKFNHFKQLFPIYQHYKLYGAMAAFCFNGDTKQALLEQGHFVIERRGDLIKTEHHPQLKCKGVGSCIATSVDGAMQDPTTLH